MHADVANRLRTETNLALLSPRLAIGATMLYHGTGMLTPEGTTETGQLFESVGLRPGRQLAIMTGVAEWISGALALAGVGTRLAALAVLAIQTIAITNVRGAKGYDIRKGGYEYNAALITMALALLVRGPGGFSLHEWLERRVEGRRPRRLFRRARPSPLLRAVKLLQ
jgi:putative oxidoreductase